MRLSAEAGGAKVVTTRAKAIATTVANWAQRSRDEDRREDVDGDIGDTVFIDWRSSRIWVSRKQGVW